MNKPVILLWEDSNEKKAFKFENLSTTEYDWFKNIHNRFYGNENDLDINKQLDRVINLIGNHIWDKYEIQKATLVISGSLI